MPLKKLIAGHRAFHETTYPEYKPLYEKLVDEGQSPEAMIISCCDSRADPVIITQAEPGMLFSVRNVANLVPPYSPSGEFHGTSSALEFGVRHLKIKDIIVMGHAHCGGIKALYRGAFDNQQNVDFIEPWMSIAEEARRKALQQTEGESEEKILRKMEEESVKLSLKNLRSFKWIAEREQEGSLHLHGWYFEIATGTLFSVDEATGVFSPLL